MRHLHALTLTTLLLIGSAANAQTAGGPDRASPGAMPAETPLTTSGTPRAATATPATPASIGSNKPARPRRARHPARAVPASH